MTIRIFDRFWHRTLGRPYSLARVVDAGQAQSTPVVLLHGIGRTGQVWQHVVELLAPLGVRVAAFDLLGFGASPQPDWPRYDTDDHAQAVIAAITKLHLREPAILVGHSMGCLVAVRVARLRPDLVRHLVLYEMPLYEGLPEKRRYRLRTDLYLKFYRRLTRYQPSFNDRNVRLSERLGRKVVGFEVTAQTWQPFIKSLEHTIIEQTAADDIRQLDMPMDVIYGNFDMFVIRGKAEKFFGADTENIAVHNIRARHVISPKASRFLVGRIEAALNGAASDMVG
jgi:pimeloyl-ACP methyl ester carboxylesterase